MATPYDNTDGGKSYNREERRIAALYDIDLDAIEAGDEDEDSAPVPAIFEMTLAEHMEQRRAEIALRFVQAPTMAMCLNLMGLR